MIQFEVLTSSESLLGEGISISQDKNCIAWVDILGNKVFNYFLSSKELSVWENWINPSCTFQDSTDWIYVAHNGGIDKFNKFTGSQFHCVAWFDPLLNLRCNDGKMDSQGNIWISTMSKTGETGRGGIWKWSPNSSPILVKSGLTIPNSISLNEITGHFYYADTPQNIIFVDVLNSFDLPSQHDRIFFDGRDCDGLPDGSALDKYGFLWNSRWDGQSIVRISPEGKLDSVTRTPFSRPTSLVFDCSERMFVTSAMTEEGLEKGFTYQASI